MSFWDHLEELRGVIVHSALILLAVFTVGFFFKDFLFDGVVLKPARPDFWLYRLLGVDLNLELINIDIAAQFFTHIKVTFLVAVVICFPVICFELWKFVAPGLYDNERSVIKKAFGLGAGLFYLGIAVGYFIVMPVLLFFFNGYQVSGTIENTFALTSYISIFMAMVFVMGLLFEFPSVLAVLSHVGLINRDDMKEWRRYAIVVILILSAILTPTGDPFTMLVVALPLYLLYEFSIFICKPKADDDDDEEDDEEDEEEKKEEKRGRLEEDVDGVKVETAREENDID